jgi:glycosyltransferase involved in cell wall biosynthesis
MEQQAQQSIIDHFPIRFIPNAVDTTTFEPLESDRCRSILGIPTDKWVLMFSALSLRDHRKGVDLLAEALQRLPASARRKIVLLLAGTGGDEFLRTTSIPSVALGYVSHERISAMAYSAADLFIFPTRAEPFGLVLAESLACGTPVVSFRVGGVPDLIRPGTTGYLAKPGDSGDLAKGILQLLEDETARRRMSQQCREIAVQEYSVDLMVTRYSKLYEELLAAGNAPIEHSEPLSR